MKKIYYLSTCSTCKRILKELNLDGVELQDIKKQAIDEKQLAELYALAGSYESMFSKRAQKYKALGLGEKDLKEGDFKHYLLEDYTFLKRPVAVIGDKIFIGNSKATVAALAEELS